MIATFGVTFRTGYDLSDNDLYRIAELIEEAIGELAGRYCADYEVHHGHFIPGPRVLPSGYGGPAPGP